jgi:hypothetical protein
MEKSILESQKQIHHMDVEEGEKVKEQRLALLLVGSIGLLFGCKFDRDW